jgi:hypothetical protein
MDIAINEVEHFPVDRGSTTPLQISLKRWNVGLFLSALSGILSGVGGIAIGFMAAGELVSPGDGFYTTSAILVGFSFILFGFAAHCLDKMEAVNKAMRLEYCRQTGLKDSQVTSLDGTREGFTR